MPEQKRNPFSRPFATVSRAAATSLAYIRGSRGPFIETRQSAALKNVDTRKWTAPLLKQLEWRRFEELCAAYFQALGFRTDIVHAGGGVDINLYAQGAERASIVVQCQPWNAYRVGIKPVRGLLGTMASANVAEGVLVT